MTEVVPTNSVSLETLLVDFFKEVGKKRLDMARIYGKRHAGRKKRLFAELSKRYGAAKVAALKVRFNNESSGDSSAVTNHGKGSNDLHANNSPDVLTHTKVERQGHPRHPQFVHLPTPASNVGLSADVGVPSATSPVASFQEKDESPLRHDRLPKKLTFRANKSLQALQPINSISCLPPSD